MRSIVGTALVILFGAQGAASQDLTAKGLAGLHQVHVVAALNRDAISIGISVKIIESLTLVALRRDVPQLAINEEAISYVYVNIIIAKVKSHGGKVLGCTASPKLSVGRPVKVLNDDLTVALELTMADVWDKSTLQYGPCDTMARQVKNDLDELLALFAADYYKANP